MQTVKEGYSCLQCQVSFIFFRKPRICTASHVHSKSNGQGLCLHCLQCNGTALLLTLTCHLEINIDNEIKAVALRRTVRFEHLFYTINVFLIVVPLNCSHEVQYGCCPWAGSAMDQGYLIKTCW